MKKIATALVALVLAGCQTPQQVAPPPSPSVPSAVPPQRLPQPPVQSAGPLTRAGVETYMDAQEADLRSYLRGQGILVARRGDSLALTVQSDKLFEGGVLSAWGNAFLQSVAQVFAHYDRTIVEVNGYSDGGGSEQQALAASQKRAKAIGDGLASYGISPARLKVNGLGAADLRVADVRDARNRRIEIKITPNPQ
jgi:outer membrane protein OmpA-like peptidoglycan-associated protein